MRFIADFHIHSRFSIATSRYLVPESLDYWARVKGLNVIGTGDCQHPGWLKELNKKLEPAGNGLYRIKREFILPEISGTALEKEQVYFIPSTEISSIYKKNGKVRKIHTICIFPDFESVRKFQKYLAGIGNIESDGRPILGLDPRVLLSKLLDISDKAFIIPAHIWTPWFSVLGSKSGFDSIEECFEDLTSSIFAVETGLSSDPPMNRMCSILDKFRLVSNSDAHSPNKLGREANIFYTDLNYESIYNSLKYDKGFWGTIEFFPQEGKYHYDGHRNCNLACHPDETRKSNDLCPVCNKELTIGVLNRVHQIADRVSPEKNNQQHFSITPLSEILTEITGVKSQTSKKVLNEYFRLIHLIGSEFHILLFSDLEEIKSKGSEILSEGIRRLRQGDIYIKEGYDGEFGRVRVFNKL